METKPQRKETKGQRGKGATGQRGKEAEIKVRFYPNLPLNPGPFDPLC